MYRGWKLVVLLPRCSSGVAKHFLTVHAPFLITGSQYYLGLFSLGGLVSYLKFLNTQVLSYLVASKIVVCPVIH
jgi:hypothetical protein